MKRMSRNRQVVTRMNLTSLMDVFTILVFFLLVNSASTEVLETDEVTVQGEAVIRTEDILALEGERIPPIGARLAEVSGNIIGVRTQAAAESQEVTILADRSVPFRIVKKVMATCTREGYGRISLAVLQKASQTAHRGQPTRAS
jgi:biopolymer transport protein ExbD